MAVKFSPAVVIYAKIGAEQFPQPAWCDDNFEPQRPCTGQEVFDFLMSDAKYCCPLSDNGNEIQLTGDKVIWVLCCNEKGGQLIVDDWETEWGWDEASPDLVARYLDVLKNRDVITADQYRLLIAEVIIARQHFGIHYDIAPFLAAQHFIGQMTIPHQIVPAVTKTPASEGG